MVEGNVEGRRLISGKVAKKEIANEDHLKKKNGYEMKREAGHLVKSCLFL